MSETNEYSSHHSENDSGYRNPGFESNDESVADVHRENNDSVEHTDIKCAEISSEAEVNGKVHHFPSQDDTEETGEKSEKTSNKYVGDTKEQNGVGRKESKTSEVSERSVETFAQYLQELQGSRHRRNGAISLANLSGYNVVLEERERKKKKYNIILDHGWAWMVLLSGFLCHFIVDGASSSFGVFYVLFLEEFGKSRGLTSWVGSLQVSLMHLMGDYIYLVTDSLIAFHLTL